MRPLGTAVFALAGRAVESGYELRSVVREVARLTRDLLLVKIDASRAADPEAYYVEVVLPDKLRMARDYVRHASILYDLRLILTTLVVPVGHTARDDEYRSVVVTAS